MDRSLTARFVGFFASLLLTLTAFWLIANPSFFHLSKGGALVAILVLAVLQAVVQSIFFLNVLSEKGTRWNLIVFASTISIILIIIIFSIWVMDHLNYRMM